MKKLNFGCIVKILALVAVMVLGVFIYITFTNNTGCGCHRIDKTEPDVSQAPYKVTTMTHIYYAMKTIQHEDGSVTMINWYERIGDKWVLHQNTENIQAVLRPKVERR